MASKAKMKLELYVIGAATVEPEALVVPFRAGRLVSVFASLNTSSQATLRVVTLDVLQRGENMIYRIPSIATQGSLLQVEYVWVPGIGAYVSGGSSINMQPLPSLGIPIERFDTLQVRTRGGHSTDDAYGPTRFMFQVGEED